MTPLLGRRALVTGAASGIGLATARLLQEQGAVVVLLDRSVDSLEKVVSETGLVSVACDVTEPDAVERAIVHAAGEIGGVIDLLVNAAGVYRIARAIDIAAADWNEVLNANLRGSFLVARAVAGALIEAEQPGSIVNVASTSALRGYAAEPSVHYNASKAGIVSMTQQLAIEWGPHGIRVNAVCPGVIDTPMLGAMNDPTCRDYLDGGLPLQRLGTAEEVARCIAFLASDLASYVTGTALVIDGGATAI